MSADVERAAICGEICIAVMSSSPQSQQLSPASNDSSSVIVPIECKAVMARVMEQIHETANAAMVRDS